MTDQAKIETACNDFLAEWDRKDWMSIHGDWASEEWSDARAEYDEAVKEVKSAMVPGDRLRDSRELLTALETLTECIEALDGQVLPDEFDYIAEGTIDPDSVEEEEEDGEPLDVGHSERRWNCTEGWMAYQFGDALVINWYRVNCSGGRHERDLWVVVDEKFFLEEG